MIKNVLVAMTSILLLSTLAQAAQRVTLRNGQVISADDVFRLADGSYQITTRQGATLTLSKDEVIRVEEEISFQKEYERKLARIDRSSPADHFALGQWAMDRKEYQVAHDELRRAIELADGSYERAELLLRQVEAKLNPPSTQPATQSSTRAIPPAQPDALLSPNEIARVRLMELRATDSVVLEFHNTVVARFIDFMTGRDNFDSDRFYAMTPMQKAMMMLEKAGRDSGFTQDIVIRTDPRFMTDFRSQIWPMVAQNCATANCHGGEKGAGGFKLINVANKTERTDYTNFILLDGYAARRGRLINRSQPELSLLLQYGLPAEQAQFKHPLDLPVIFKNRQADNYQRVNNWIRSLQTPHPDYRIEKYKPPLKMKLRFENEVDLPIDEPATRPGK